MIDRPFPSAEPSANDETLPASPPSSAGLPRKIGQYSIKRLIGRGGMGVVYEAVQEHPRRTVALKVLKPGLASPSALRRFEYEAQLLARLQHPNIAQVYEAGTDESLGEPVPFFALEYIPHAKPITSYAEEKGLGVRERLGLLVQVCEAVHHGHQKGIIHRDLKPGNILVNAQGLVKIIDFGVARATDSDLALTTLQTDVGQLLGTMQYMSPEQCAADPHAIDTRSDVYALGVVAYELLCGALPYDVTRAPLTEAARVICEEEPKRPSTVNRRLRGDVETIALKALEKEPSRRYQSALQLGEDLRRYLAGEAIVGRPPSLIYQLRVFARRHRLRLAWLAAGLAVVGALLTVSFGALVAVLTVLVAGLLVSSALFVRAEQARAAAAEERDRAVLAEQEAERRRVEAEAQRREAEVQRAQAEAVTKFLSDTLAAVDPAEAKGREVTVKEVLEKAARQISTAFSAQPLVEATLRATIGNTYHALGDYPAAAGHLEAALAIHERQSRADDRAAVGSLNDLSILYQDQGRYEEAEMLCRKACALGSDALGDEHPQTLAALSNLARLHQFQGRYAEAEAIFGRTLPIRTRVLGEEHPNTLNDLSNLAVIYQSQGRFQEAEPLWLRALELHRRVLGEEHPGTLSTMNNLAVLYQYQSRYAAAEPLLVKLLELRRRVLGEEHPETLAAMNNLAGLYYQQGQLQDVEPLLLKGLELTRRLLTEEHPDALAYLHNLAALYQRLGRYTEAEPLLVKAVALHRRVLGEEHPATLAAVTSLAAHYQTQGRYEEAEPLFLKALEVQRRVLGEEHLATMMTLSNLATLLRNRHRYEEGERLYLKVLEGFRRVVGEQHTETRKAITGLIKLYDAWGKPEQATAWRAKLPAPAAEQAGGKPPENTE